MPTGYVVYRTSTVRLGCFYVLFDWEEAYQAVQDAPAEEARDLANSQLAEAIRQHPVGGIWAVRSNFAENPDW